ncbi:hypothetical protein Patl1_37071 [Pistacia atlantica]|nr:hypothetical protein Patl1_37071 [Pistacia atlantica]
MAVSCSTNQPLLFHFIIITILFSLVIPFASSLSLNYSKVGPIYGDNMKTSYGDGLAFFLAPEGLIIPTIRGGGSFGLTKDDKPLNSTSNPFVRVEFDIFYNNGWDPIPPSDHVGIDISSLRSSTNVSWLSNVEGGQRNEAWISYNSSTQNLSVAFTGFRNNVTVMQYLDYEIDLRLYLPELVTFGFSAATGSQYAIFSVYSWEFNSSLEAANRPPPSDNSTPIVERQSRRRKSRAGLALTSSCGASSYAALLNNTH